MLIQPNFRFRKYCNLTKIAVWCKYGYFPHIFRRSFDRQLWKAAIINKLSYFEKQSLAKKMFLKTSQNSKWNNCVRVSFLTNLQTYTFIKKETLEEEVSFHLVSKLPLRRSKFHSLFRNIHFKAMFFFKTKNVKTLNFLLEKKGKDF